MNDLLTRLNLDSARVTKFTGMAIKGRIGRKGTPRHVLDAMYAEYQAGSSLADVGRVWGRTRQSIYEVFTRAGLPMRAKKLKEKIVWHGENFSPNRNGYYESTVRDGILLHHLIYEGRTGRKIPEGWQVGFIDGDKANFAATNLICLPIREMSLFHQRRLHPSARLPEPERIARRLKMQRESAARRAAAFVAQGLRTDGRERTRHDGNRAWRALRDRAISGIRDLPPAPPPKKSRATFVPKVCPDLIEYDQFKKALGIGS